ncbi:BTAD domain-containing putative transcriptional regulator [Saccharothrix coeruleofusca]|uniref:DNA-binding SARP family transcriptional activator n=1 Tax=Saccharothrix coeruleofusca TaxID=33919 RepID=A0A918AMV9_9PSEU|nr:BTAD domain-containing putative transcriptional regulator [Saccharothrix coeruleofusca]MBP2337854.1 DNA-binding SARP family transcriptional activator/DNA-binding XRE family transcriptional regulator [Saccharothrix coeruleofusca]GGP62719.1 hypothetical protein GCM10010185_39000 [Saccharothrix coeruleofusca]
MGTKTFGEELRARRARLGLTQREVALRAGISVRAVRYIESGQVSAPRPASLHRLAATVGLDPAAYLGGRPATRLGVLGPLVVRRGGEPVRGVPLMQRCLLGLLALHPNRVVGREEIIEVLWSGRPPLSHAHLVHNYAARVRRLCRVERVGHGYRLVADARQLDLVRFAELTGDHDDPARLAEAVRLWRGPVLADLPDAVRQHPTAVALHQQRIAAVLAHTELVLRQERAGALTPSLIELAHHEPLHEGVQAAHLLALARSGQQAAALRLFDRVRERLAAELGVDPGPQLRAAHLRVLRQAL